MFCLRRLALRTIWNGAYRMANNKVATRSLANLSFRIEPNFLCKNNLFVTVNRFKGNKPKETDQELEEELKEWRSEDELLNKIAKVISVELPSLRLDHVIKAAFKYSRNNIETNFYQSNIRLNGTKALKKSVKVYVGDEIDIVKSFNNKNPTNLNISRIELLDLKNEDEKIMAIVRTYKSLVIENYEDPWSPVTS